MKKLLGTVLAIAVLLSCTVATAETENEQYLKLVQMVGQWFSMINENYEPDFYHKLDENGGMMECFLDQCTSMVVYVNQNDNVTKIKFVQLADSEELKANRMQTVAEVIAVALLCGDSVDVISADDAMTRGTEIKDQLIEKANQNYEVKEEETGWIFSFNEEICYMYVLGEHKFDTLTIKR